MESTLVIQGIEWVARGLEFLGIALIGFSFLYATIRGVLRIGSLRPEDYQRNKDQHWKSAADPRGVPDRGRYHPHGNDQAYPPRNRNTWFIDSGSNVLELVHHNGN